MDYGSDGKFCSTACSSADDCPDGYDCKPDETDENLLSCIPFSGKCGCDKAYYGFGYETDCYNDNAFGKCMGKRICGEKGLTECDAAFPSEDIIDGIDNDCDGKTDEAMDEKCDDKLDCTKDYWDKTGEKCVNEPVDGKCFIGGKCFDNGGKNPENKCKECSSSFSKIEWYDNNNPCDDGNDCTKQDICSSGACGGIYYVCNDNTDCTDDKCKGDGQCEFLLQNYYCLIGNKCYQNKDFNPLNNCLVCDSETNKYGWSFREGACDDDNSCTEKDICVQGDCSGILKCDDNLECTKDFCDQSDSSCFYILSPSYCRISETCYKAGEKNPLNDCEWCSPDENQNEWTERSGFCDDSNKCTINDFCEDGKCLPGSEKLNCDDSNECTDDLCEPSTGCDNVNVLDGKTCDDHDDCTVSDACKDGACTGKNECSFCDETHPCPDNGNKCDGVWICDLNKKQCKMTSLTVSCSTSEDTECKKNLCVPSTGVCEKQPVNEGGKCDDEIICTKDDHCAQGVCIGDSYICDDGKDCTDDVCLGNGKCDHPVKKDKCLISGVCYKNGDINPANPCQKCSPDESPISWSAVDIEKLCDDKNSCTFKDKCYFGTCKGELYACEKDNWDCADRICDGKGGCVIKIFGGKCLIENECYENMEWNPANTCQWCDVLYNNEKWTVRENNSPCDDGNKCTSDEQCKGGNCSGTVCPEDGNICTIEQCNPSAGCEPKCDTAYFKDCYDGDSTLIGHGECKGGKRFCAQSVKVCDFSPVCDGQVLPEPETCNNKDDDCNDQTDEGENNEGCVKYFMDADDDGYGVSDDMKCLCGPQDLYRATLPDDCDDSNPFINPSAGYDPPDNDFIDQDCDGIDGTINKALFVSEQCGNDSGSSDGSPEKPFRTIQKAIEAAEDKTISDIYVNQGKYPDGFYVMSGVSVFGGYQAVFDVSCGVKADWSLRDFGNLPEITNSQKGTVGKKDFSGIIGQNITCVIIQDLDKETKLDGLNLFAQNLAGYIGQSPAVNTYGIYIANSFNFLKVTNCTIQSGPGARGANGASGTDGGKGEDGKKGDDGKSIISQTTPNPKTDLSWGGDGGINCGMSKPSKKGGNGGRSVLCPYDEMTCKNMNLGENTSWDGEKGYPGENNEGGGAGGNGGFGYYVKGMCGTLFPVGSGDDGIEGKKGDDGQNGVKTQDGGGFVFNGNWSGYSGGNGLEGKSGHGGGGGGGGGGISCMYQGTSSQLVKITGGGGGGGGAGGCGGISGQGGRAGGGAFGIFSVQSQPVIMKCTVRTLEGGQGGDGGDGGAGGEQGKGFLGGSPFDFYDKGLKIFSSGAGGMGGTGGAGGKGGGGAGGAGGVSFGIFSADIMMIPIISEIIFEIGEGGAGGKGGQGVLPAPDGEKGAAGETNFLD
jgi:hypothetical protein